MSSPPSSPSSSSDPADMMTAVGWWERRRGWFNLVVALAGALPFLGLGTAWRELDVWGALGSGLLWMLLANAWYCLGWGAEILWIHYSSRSLWPQRGRQIWYVLLLVGTSVWFFLMSLSLVLILSLEIW